MHTHSLVGTLAFWLPTLSIAAPHLSPPVDKRQDCTFDSAVNPTCWDGTFDLSTNWYEETPDTGVVREYWFDVTNSTGAPDGFERMILTINGSIPGPTIIADWGDTVVVHVTNSLADNGTSIHWHGIHQRKTNEADGVASITQCPTAPGESMTYTWRATQYGTSWYHSHFSLQAWNGVFGGIIINGPASAPYDEDLGVLILSDWSHQTTDELYPSVAVSGPPKMENGLINGTNVYGDLGNRFETTFESGKSYLIRLVNSAIDTHFKFMIDGHTMTVIAADFVPIVPFDTADLSIGIGQRYDVIVTADQTADNYWLRAIPQITCSDNDNTLNIKGIVRYGTSSSADPTGEVPSYTDNCLDMPMASLVPVVALEAAAETYDEDLAVGLAIVGGQFKWTLNSNTFVSDWGYTTLEQVLAGDTTYDAQQNVIALSDTEAWVYFIIQNPIGVTHPIHLHGHDFWVLAQGTGTYDESTVTLQTVNSPRRDVAMLPGSGYLVIGFYTDNPGVWLMHCHIGWHTSLGFALQLVERPDEIAGITNQTLLSDTCAAWNTYAETSFLEQEDSGV